MGKLVIYGADGAITEVVLRKERITIGRRPDNDVCLPFPAVSGEHAQVVTILTDSFLEDLGSTNGTLVNGKAAAKHFLRDRDVIDIGRQRLTYLSDDTAKVDAVPPDMLIRQLRGMAERVDGVKPMPKPVVTVGGETSRMRQGEGSDDLERVLAAGTDEKVIAAIAPAAMRATQRSPAQAGEPPPAPAPMAPQAAATAPEDEAPKPSVRVLSGASQGRTVAFQGAELTVGRVGVQVAVVRRLDTGGYLLIPLEGRESPRINGAAVAPAGSPLHPGDTFEVAGVRLELSVHS